ncbi:hypothetical protein [Pseudoalteromonas ostreae]|uniref:hypothetical protein n=1 Tax=Pseudoalteromonas ostreae TaxID=2774154 RepID=UPI001B36FBD7|nr:hypothetical protein [Pseudoalteromonas ostreae]
MNFTTEVKVALRAAPRVNIVVGDGFSRERLTTVGAKLAGACDLLVELKPKKLYHLG